MKGFKQSENSNAPSWAKKKAESAAMMPVLARKNVEKQRKNVQRCL